MSVKDLSALRAGQVLRYRDGHTAVLKEPKANGDGWWLVSGGGLCRAALLGGEWTLEPSPGATAEELALYAIARAIGLGEVDAILAVQSWLRSDLVADRRGQPFADVVGPFESHCESSMAYFARLASSRRGVG